MKQLFLFSLIAIFVISSCVSRSAQQAREERLEASYDIEDTLIKGHYIINDSLTIIARPIIFNSGRDIKYNLTLRGVVLEDIFIWHSVIIANNRNLHYVQNYMLNQYKMYYPVLFKF